MTIPIYGSVIDSLWAVEASVYSSSLIISRDNLKEENKES